jgi:RNA polymerase sigma factor (sigma-70 family)
LAAGALPPVALVPVTALLAVVVVAAALLGAAELVLVLPLPPQAATPAASASAQAPVRISRLVVLTVSPLPWFGGLGRLRHCFPYYALGRQGDWRRAIQARRPHVNTDVDPSDESLLAGFATGDARTAAAFVRRFQGRVYGLALTIVRQPALAEEVAQETFTRVYRHAGNYDARKGKVSTWLLSIARNLAIDVTRMRRLDPVDPEVIAAEVSISSQSPAADEVAVQPDERDQLRAAIGELPDDQRRALVLAAYMGRTAREISDLDDVPLGTVKTRIRTAMLKLRDELEVGRDE